MGRKKKTEAQKLYHKWFWVDVGTHGDKKAERRKKEYEKQLRDMGWEGWSEPNF